MVPRPRCPPTATTTASGSRRPTSASRRRTSSSCGSPCRSSSAAHAVRRPSFCFSPTARCSASPAPTTYRSRGRPTRPRPSRERPRTTGLGSTRPANPARRPCRSATRSCFPVARAVNTTPTINRAEPNRAVTIGRSTFATCLCKRLSRLLGPKACAVYGSCGGARVPRNSSRAGCEEGIRARGPRRDTGSCGSVFGRCYVKPPQSWLMSKEMEFLN